jgi:peptide/nickel transport system substrate-binding protein
VTSARRRPGRSRGWRGSVSAALVGLLVLGTTVASAASPSAGPSGIPSGLPSTAASTAPPTGPSIAPSTGFSPGPSVDPARTLRIGTDQEFDSINPNLAFIASSAEAVLLDYDTLVGIGPDMDYAPTGFATSWVQDGTAWTFTIRSGMHWSDGEPADADDVAFTYRYVLASMDPRYVGPWAPDGNDRPEEGGTRSDGVPDDPLSLYGDLLVGGIGLRSVEAIDATTVRMTTAAPTTLLLGAGVPILPEHVWSTVTFASAVTDFGANPPVVGSGPFQAVEWARGASARFARNARYWGPPPYLDAIDFRFYPDPGSVADALRAGAIDYARPVAPGDLDGLDADPAIVGLARPGRGYTHLAFNTYGKPIDGGGASTTAVRDPAFRDALGYAIDGEALVRDVLDGHGVPGSTIVPPLFAPFHVDPTRARRFDLAEARRRLETAGYRDSDGDGIREDAQGRRIELRIDHPTDDPSYGRAAASVASWWRQVGIASKVTGYPSDTLAELMYVPEAGGTADYDVELWGWTGSPDPDFQLGLLTSGQIGVWSDSNYSNPAYDQLYLDQQRAPTIDARREVVARMQQLAYDEAPYLILYYADDLSAYRTDRFEGWTAEPASTDRPSGGLFRYGVQGYLDLVAAGSRATPTPPQAASQPATPAAASPSVGPTPGPGGLPSDPALITGAVIAGIAAVALGTAWLARRRRSRRPD